jgi:transcriptional regulator with XRE-family HTH domain
MRPVSVRSDQARLRVREEMERQRLSQRDVAGLLGWSQSRVAKILTGRVQLVLDDLEALCFAVSLPLTEAVRDHGLEFCAEMTPTELRALESLRRTSDEDRAAILTLLRVRTKPAQPDRYAAPLKPPVLKRRS